MNSYAAEGSCLIENLSFFIGIALTYLQVASYSLYFFNSYEQQH